MLNDDRRQRLVAALGIGCLVLIALSAAYSGRSQQPSLSVSVNTKQQDRHTNTEGTAGQSSDESAPNRQLVQLTGDLATYTLDLFIATVVVACATLGLGFAGFFQWREIRRTANISERALVDLEAPFLSIKIENTGVSRKDREIGHNFEQLSFSIANFGRTPATLVELVDKTKMVPINEGNPPPIDFDFRSRNTLPRGVISPPAGDSQLFSRNLYADHLSDLAADGLPLSVKALFFYGFVRYETIFAQTLRMGFCFIFDRYSDTWVLSGDERYNYLENE